MPQDIAADRPRSRTIAQVTAALSALALTVGFTVPAASAAGTDPEAGSQTALAWSLPAAAAGRDVARSDKADIGPLVAGIAGQSVAPSDPARQRKVLRRKARLMMSKTDASQPLAPNQDVGVITVVQDVRAKKVTVTAPFQAAPSAEANSVVAVYVGSFDEARATCTWNYAIEAMAWSTSAKHATVERPGRVAAGTARRSLSGSTLKVTVTGEAAAQSSHNCVYADLFVLDGGPGRFAKASPAKDFAASLEPGPELTLSSAALHAAYPGTWSSVRLSVRNTGTRTAKNVVVKASGKRLKVKKSTIKLGKIAPGKSKSTTVRVKLRGKKTRKLTIKARAKGRWSTSTTTKVGHRRPPTKVKRLAGKRYVASKLAAGRGWTVHGLTFVNRTWVYRGLPPQGTPKCSSKIKKCARYTYSPRTGRLTVGKTTATVDSEGITWPTKGGAGPTRHYEPLKPLKKRSRLATRLVYQDSTGCERPGDRCRAWSRLLTLKKNGTFSWTYEGTVSGPQGARSISRRTTTGTYVLLSKGRIRLSYEAESGKRKKKIYPVALIPDALGRYSPKKGLLLAGMPHLAP